MKKDSEATRIVKPEPQLNIKDGPGPNIPDTFQEQSYVPTHNRPVEPPEVLQGWTHAEPGSWTTPKTQSGGWSSTRQKK